MTKCALQINQKIKKTPTANHVMDKRLIRCLAYNASVAQMVEQLKKEVSCIETCSRDTDVSLVQIQPEAIYAESGQEVKSRAIYASRFWTRTANVQGKLLCVGSNPTSPHKPSILRDVYSISRMGFEVRRALFISKRRQEHGFYG